MNFSFAFQLALLMTTFLTPFSASAPPNAEASQPVRDRFAGSWRLIWLEEPGVDGKLHRASCTGLLVYTADGHMSVQVMYDKARQETGGGQPQYAQGGYEATFGTYEVNESARTFTLRVEGALVRNLLGKTMKRNFELSGKQMIVTAANSSEHWRVAWEHF
jgi:hypothetical protein